MREVHQEVRYVLPASWAITCFLNIRHELNVLSVACGGPYSTVATYSAAQVMESCNIHVSCLRWSLANTINIMSYENLSRELLFVTSVTSVGAE